jgi:hypothetical protein
MLLGDAKGRHGRVSVLLMILSETAGGKKNKISQIRNSKHEIRNKFKARNLKSETRPDDFLFGILIFRFVSDFDIRISDFRHVAV